MASGVLHVFEGNACLTSAGDEVDRSAGEPGAAEEDLAAGELSGAIESRPGVSISLSLLLELALVLAWPPV